jgi:DNA repair protein RecO
VNRYPNSHAIVLSVELHGEKDLEGVMLHELWGKRRLVARGGRSSRKGTSAALQSGNLLLCQIYKGRSHDTWQQGEIVSSPFGSITSPSKLLTMHYFLWLIKAWCEWDSPVPELYHLLALALKTLATFPDGDLTRLRTRFEVALLRIEGLSQSGKPFAEVFYDHAHLMIPAQFAGRSD